jgi:hypothetical protein
MTDTFDIGDSPTITCTFKTSADVLADPTTVTFVHRDGAGVETSYVNGVAAQVSHPSTGVYAFQVPTITTSGAHAIRCKGVGALIAAVEQRLSVRVSAFTTP